MMDSQNEQPQIFSVQQGLNGRPRFSRRDFLKTAGVAAAVGTLASGAGITHAQDSDPAQIAYTCRDIRAHTDHVYTVAISPDGALLASGSWDLTVKVWSLPGGELLHTLTGHENAVLAVVISPDSTLLASGSWDNTIKLWSLPSGELLHTLTGHNNGVVALAISPDGRLLASGSWDNTIKLWSLPDGRLQRTLTGHNDWINSVAISPDGRFLASGSSDDTIKLWSLPNGALLRTLEGHDATVASLTIADLTPTPDDDTPAPPTLVFEATSNINIRSGPGTDYAVVGALETGESVTADGRNQAGDWVHLQREQPGDAWVYASLLTPVDEGDLLTLNVGAASSVARQLMLASGSGDGTIKLWSLPDGSLLQTLTGHDFWVNSVASSPDGALLASGSEDMTLKLWSLPDGALLGTINGHSDVVSAVAISPDGRLLASGSHDNTIKLWSLPGGTIQSCLIDLASNSTVYGVTYEEADSSGQLVTHTLPCGSAIPSGTVCTCNCVSVRGTGCSCVGHRPSGGGGSYWYPN